MPKRTARLIVVIAAACGAAGPAVVRAQTPAASSVVAADPQAEFAKLDRAIAGSFDRPDRHAYTTVDATIGELEIDPQTKAPIRGKDGTFVYRTKGKYRENAAEAEKWDRELETFSKRCQSPLWVAAAMERRAKVYDTLRSGLADASIELFDAVKKNQLAAMRASGRPDLVLMASRIEAGQAAFWRRKKEQELDGVDSVMIRLYAAAVAYAVGNKVTSASLTRALRRLSYYASLLGEDRMATLVRSTPDPMTGGAQRLTYQEGQYAQAP